MKAGGLYLTLLCHYQDDFPLRPTCVALVCHTQPTGLVSRTPQTPEHGSAVDTASATKEPALRKSSGAPKEDFRQTDKFINTNKLGVGGQSWNAEEEALR